MAEPVQGFEMKCQIIGWVLFVFSSLFYMASSIRHGDPLGFAGGAVFLVACIVFLIPLFKSPAPREPEEKV
jgi:hypothetical protein